ncbi:hypothetical protein B0H10DRAFT_1956802 [Mycena sp. CBHHK59/15]|nr:hypothetical protein B0H10DRAFT_1956802 [Mycena sp. CBHHK59/15]
MPLAEFLRQWNQRFSPQLYWEYPIAQYYKPRSQHIFSRLLCFAPHVFDFWVKYRMHYCGVSWLFRLNSNDRRTSENFPLLAQYFLSDPRKMTFCKDRVRLVALYKMSQNISAREFEVQLGPRSLANDSFTQAIQPVGLPKSQLNLEAESYEKIMEIMRDPAFSKILETSISTGGLDTTTIHVFSPDFVTKIDK